jgi:Transglycosylase SLT domain
MKAAGVLCLLVSCGAFSTDAKADVQILRRPNGSIMIFNDVGSGWLVKGRTPSDHYLLSRKDAATPFDEAIRNHSSRRGLDERLVRSVILVESNFNPQAVSRKGARGLMQLMPQTAHRYGVKNVHDAVENIRGGVAYLADLMVMFRGDLPLVFAAYNAGEGAVERHSGVPPYPETREYVRRAMLVYGGGGGSLLGGGFRGHTAGMHARLRTSRPSAPVRLGRSDGGAVISNVFESSRMEPVLGRVEMGENRRTK